MSLSKQNLAVPTVILPTIKQQIVVIAPLLFIFNNTMLNPLLSLLPPIPLPLLTKKLICTVNVLTRITVDVQILHQITPQMNLIQKSLSPS